MLALLPVDMGRIRSTCPGSVAARKIALLCVIPAPIGRVASNREQAGTHAPQRKPLHRCLARHRPRAPVALIVRLESKRPDAWVPALTRKGAVAPSRRQGDVGGGGTRRTQLYGLLGCGEGATRSGTRSSSGHGAR